MSNSQATSPDRLNGGDEVFVTTNKSVWQRLLGNPTAMVSITILVVIALSAILAPILAPGNPLKVSPANRFISPGAEHPFGTDNLGRDMFKMVLHGGRTSLFVGLVVTVISMSIAVVLGAISGFYRQVDVVLMRFVDGLMAFPGIVLATAAAGIMGPSMTTVITSLSIVLIAPSLRVVRGQVLVVRELQMIEAARSVGVPTLRLFTRYILPAVSSPILVQASFIFSAAVLGEAGLSFIGVGIGPKELSWGNALTEARNYISQAPWIVLFPGLALMLTILALNLLGDSLRDILDPRLAPGDADMLRYLGKRFLLILPTIFVPLLLVFLLLRLSPGDPAGMMLGDQATPEQIAALRSQLGLDQPIFVQFWIWLKGILTLDLGNSIFFREPVMQIIPRYATVTILLTIVALALAVLIGITLGLISAMNRNKPIDRGVVTAAVLGISLPEFWFALLLIFVFAVTLRWFPVAGYNPPDAGIIAFGATIFLPALALGVRQSALMTRMMRSSMLDVLNEPYITTARAQGLPEKTVIGSYAMRTAAMPVVTVVGLAAGYMLGGAVAIEIIFALPGLGRMLVEAVGRRDYPLVEGGVLTISLVLAVLNLIIDLIYALLDPRIRYQ